jgi:hypothetical protein
MYTELRQLCDTIIKNKDKFLHFLSSTSVAIIIGTTPDKADCALRLLAQRGIIETDIFSAQNYKKYNVRLYWFKENT